jgi:hypothetical protein
MQEAYVTGFLRTILIIILIYYGLKYVGKILFPIFFQKIVKNVEKKVREQQGYQPEQDHVKEGETTIDRKPRQNKESNNTVGEYIDYEDVDE